MIKVLVVDDSATVREFLTHILGTDPQVEVIGTASDGIEALEAVKERQPDVITMDIGMPKMSGLEATRIIMESHPTPIVIVSGTLDGEGRASFQALEAGALAVLPRPAGIGHPNHEAAAKQLVQTVKLMSEVKVVRRWSRNQEAEQARRVSPPTETWSGRTSVKIKVIAIGASTGGPVVLQRILSGLPKDYPVPVLIVQHIADGFVQGFSEWLTQATGFPVQIAQHDEQILHGRAYIAPDGFHTTVSSHRRIALLDSKPINGLRPSVAALFRSVADNIGPESAGVLLTGMGRDGADELKLLKESGAVTIAQDKESSVIHGMPGEAIRLGAATYVLPPERIAALLKNLAEDSTLKVEGK